MIKGYVMRTDSKEFRYLKELLKLNQDISVSEAAKRLQLLKTFLSTY